MDRRYLCFNTLQMGYANPAQVTAGIHLRQWSRAFIFAESANSTRVVFVNLDICMATQIIKLEVREELIHKNRSCKG